MMIFNRRDFLKTSSLTSLALGLNLFSPEIFRRRLLAGQTPSGKRLLFIFQRGGNDGVNTVIPRGDSEYNQANRPTIYIPENQAIDLGNGFAQLHPAMSAMMEIFDNGNLAVLHRIGYKGQSQSHFDSQQFWENGLPGQPQMEEGMLYRQVVETLDPLQNRFAAAAISGSQMVALKGRVPLPNLRRAAEFTFPGTPSKVRKLLGELPPSPGGAGGSGLRGLYGGPRIDSPSSRYVYGAGLSLVDAMGIVQAAVAQGTYRPANGAVYPNDRYGLGAKLQEAAMLFKRTPVQVLGVNIGGWDTHTNQGAANGSQAGRLQAVAEGFRALARDFQDEWQDMVVVTMTEFGRTSKENGSRGTDHAYACVVFVAGGSVNGGVYNCDSTTWRDGDMFSQRGRYVAHRTDYRAVFGEIFMRHFGDDAETLRRVVTNWDSAKAADPAGFRLLGFLPA